MEEFFQALGVIGLIILLVIGVFAGVIASTVEGGRNRGRNIAIGVGGALLLPFLAALVAAGAGDGRIAADPVPGADRGRGGSAACAADLSLTPC